MIQSNIAKRKGAWCEAQRTQGTNFQASAEEPHRMHLIPPQWVAMTQVKCCLWGSSLETRCPGFLLGLIIQVKQESKKAGLKLSIQKTKIMASSPITSWQIDGEEVETVTDFLFLGSIITVDGDCSHKIKTFAPWKKNYDKPRQHIKKQRHYFADKGLYGPSYDFSSSHVWMWELDHKEGWVLKNWCFWIALEKTLEIPLDCKEI